MGLDQRITIVTQNSDSSVSTNEYWLRKVNCLQGYFEDNYEIENLTEQRFTLEDVEELKEITDNILQNQDDHEYIESHFPPTQGFFYGNYDINEWYFDDVKEVNTIINEILETDNILEMTYWCWY